MCDACREYFKEVHPKTDAVLKKLYGERIIDSIIAAGFKWSDSRHVYERRSGIMNVIFAFHES